MVNLVGLMITAAGSHARSICCLLHRHRWALTKYKTASPTTDITSQDLPLASRFTRPVSRGVPARQRVIFRHVTNMFQHTVNHLRLRICVSGSQHASPCHVSQCLWGKNNLLHEQRSSSIMRRPQYIVLVWEPQHTLALEVQLQVLDFGIETQSR